MAFSAFDWGGGGGSVFRSVIRDEQDPWGLVVYGWVIPIFYITGPRTSILLRAHPSHKVRTQFNLCKRASPNSIPRSHSIAIPSSHMGHTHRPPPTQHQRPPMIQLRLLLPNLQHRPLIRLGQIQIPSIPASTFLSSSSILILSTSSSNTSPPPLITPCASP